MNGTGYAGGTLIFLTDSEFRGSTCPFALFEECYIFLGVGAVVVRLDRSQGHEDVCSTDLAAPEVVSVGPECCLERA